ncbi:hypothetical protein [Flammeovirga pacifica]|uniref:Uncharacterized protein n=1 Tax=Flammeovirga pacifica TaxID=915059 RepID=A0A1S1YSX2_FLAPC|nr:hypothetical protein [Flammeovirga pacifica]OHX63963.1 hypothetical protein NH26_20345 [Flammeovirga pacifica]
MNSYRKIIDKFKSSKEESLLIDFKCIHNGKEAYGESDDINYINRKNLILELYEKYSAEDKTLIKWLLQEELKGFEFDIPVYTTDLCAFMLYKHMTIEDVYDLYDAKFGAGSDHQACIDIELIFGQNKDEIKAYLKSECTQKELNNEILETIECYELNKNAKFKSREEYIEYFETKKFEALKFDLG